MTIRVHTQADDEHYVVIIEDDEHLTVDGCFIDRNNAETRARSLARVYGCELTQ